jgi:WD40 repeat protein
MQKEADEDTIALSDGAYDFDTEIRQLREEKYRGPAKSKQTETQESRIRAESHEAQFLAPAQVEKGRSLGIQALDNLTKGEFSAAEHAFLEAQRCFEQAYEEAEAARAGAKNHIEQLQRDIAARKQEAIEERAPSLASPIFEQGVALWEHAQKCVEGKAWPQALEAYPKGIASFTEARDAARHASLLEVEAAKKDAVAERERALKLRCAELFSASMAKAESSFALAVDTFERGQSTRQFLRAQTLFQESSVLFRFLCTRAWEARASHAKAQTEDLATRLPLRHGKTSQYVNNSLAHAEQLFTHRQFEEACARYEKIIATLESLPKKPHGASTLPKVLRYGGITLGLVLVLFILLHRQNHARLPIDYHRPILSPSDIGPPSPLNPSEFSPRLLQTIEETVEGPAASLIFVIPGIHSAVLIRPESAALEKKEELPVTKKGRFEVTLADLPPGSSTARLLLSSTAARTSEYEIVLKVNSYPGREIQSFEDTKGEVTAVALSADATTMLSGNENGWVSTWNVATGQQLQLFRKHRGWVRSVAFSPHDRNIVLSLGDNEKALTGGTAKIWDISSGKDKFVISPHFKLYAVSLSADGETVFSGDSKGSVLQWRLGSKTPHAFAKPGRIPVTVCAFSPDGQLLLSSLSSLQEGRLQVWDTKTGNKLKEFSYQAPLTDATFSPDGTQILAASLDGTLQLWDLSTGANLARFKEKHNGKALAVVLSQPTSPLFSAEIKVLSGGTDKKVKLWDFSTGKLEREFVGHEDTVTSVAFSPDNTMALSGSSDHTIRLWWLAGKSPEKEIVLTLPEGEQREQNNQGSPSTLP